jgi:two-component system, cell cycle response regulator CtrA
MRALVAESDPTSAARVRAAIQAEGFVAEAAESGEDALELARTYDFDVALLAVRLPDMDGHEALRRMRGADVATPVLMLAPRDDRQERVRLLIAGADDYLVKPFDKVELAARLRALVRRSRGHAASVIRAGRLAVDIAARTVEIDGRPLGVTAKEYAILELLALRRGTTLTKEMFLDHLYGGLDEPEQKIIDVFVCKLRKKIARVTGGDDTGIRTVWGQGSTPGGAPAGRPSAAPGLAEADSTFVHDGPVGRQAELDLLLLELLPAG